MAMHLGRGSGLAPVTIPPVIAPKVLVGSAADSGSGGSYIANDLNEFNRLWGSGVLNRTPKARRSFQAAAAAPYAHRSSWSGHPATADVGTGRASFLSTRSSIARMNAGLDDAAVTSWVQSMPTGHKIFATWNHEVDNPSYQTASKGWDDGTTFADYRQAMARWCGLVKDARGARDITTTWTLTGYTFTTIQTRDPLDYWPGANTVEMVAPDPYNFSTSTYFPFIGNVVGGGAAWQFAADRGVRYGVAEWGCYDNASTQKARFIAEADEWMRTRYLTGPAVEVATWYHSANESPDPQGTYIDSSSTSIAAFQAHVDANA